MKLLGEVFFLYAFMRIIRVIATIQMESKLRHAVSGYVGAVELAECRYGCHTECFTDCG